MNVNDCILKVGVLGVYPVHVAAHYYNHHLMRASVCVAFSPIVCQLGVFLRELASSDSCSVHELECNTDSDVGLKIHQKEGLFFSVSFTGGSH